MNPGGWPPDTIDNRYRIVRVLGEGGMGSVYAAEDARLGNREVAIKLIRLTVQDDSAIRQRFEDEARSAGRLNHPNVVSVHDSGVSDGVAFIVMEKLAGPDLESLVRERGKLPVSLAIRYLSEAAAGLGEAHSHGIIHRDVKPANLMLSSVGVVKVLDFGIASLADRASQLTAAGKVTGSFPYLAPERLLGRPASVQSDLYSLGCVAMMLLTGQPPFSGTTGEIVHSQMNVTPPPLFDVRPDAPLALGALLDQLLAKRPEDRPHSAGAVINALQDIGSRLSDRGETVEATVMSPDPRFRAALASPSTMPSGQQGPAQPFAPSPYPPVPAPYQPVAPQPQPVPSMVVQQVPAPPPAPPAPQPQPNAKKRRADKGKRVQGDTPESGAKRRSPLMIGLLGAAVLALIAGLVFLVVKPFGGGASAAKGAGFCTTQVGNGDMSGSTRTFTWTETQEFKPGAFCMAAASSTYASGLVFRPDGNLLWLVGGTPAWESHTAGKQVAKLFFQNDGNIAIYDTGGKPLWSSGAGAISSWVTTSADKKALVVEAINRTNSDGTVERRHSVRQINSPAALGHDAPTGLTLAWEEPTSQCRTALRVVGTTEAFTPGQVCLMREDTRLEFASNGDLVLTHKGSTVWNSNTAGKGAALSLQADGNIVMYDSAGAVAWSLDKQVKQFKNLTGPASTVALELTSEGPGTHHQLHMYTDNSIVGGSTVNSFVVG